VIEPRVEEIFALVQQVIRESGYEEVLSSGIVITGGSAVMPGMVELGEDIFLKPVRRGMPRYGGALADMVAQPRAATVMGLLEEARLARVRGARVAQKHGSVKTAFGRIATSSWGTSSHDALQALACAGSPPRKERRRSPIRRSAR
jgi:cell division protein FtsA